MLEDVDDEVEVLVFEGKICFKFGNVMLILKLIDGVFLDYECVILCGNIWIMLVENKWFVEVVDCVVMIFVEKLCFVKFFLGEDLLILVVNNLESG